MSEIIEKQSIDLGTLPTKGFDYWTEEDVAEMEAAKQAANQAAGNANQAAQEAREAAGQVEANIQENTQRVTEGLADLSEIKQAAQQAANNANQQAQNADNAAENATAAAAVANKATLEMTTQAGKDHQQAVTDHTTATQDHQRATADHSQHVSDHQQALQQRQQEAQQFTEQMRNQQSEFDTTQQERDARTDAKIEEIEQAAGQSAVTSLTNIMGLYTEREPMMFESAQAGKAIVPLYEGSRFGKVETYAGAAVSKEYQVTQGDILKFKSGKTTNSIFTVSQVTTNSNGTKTYTKVMSLNELAEVPMDGYLRFLVMPSDMTIVITYFPAEPNFESTIHVYRCGAFASISAQLGNLWAVLLEDYMRKDGYSAGARVGNADNLTPRGEASAEEFVSRIAGGANQIEDGDARIVRVKGNTEVWNQYAYNDYFDSASNITSLLNATIDVENNTTAIVTPSNGSFSGLYIPSVKVTRDRAIILNHKYIVLCDMFVESANNNKMFGISDAKSKWSIRASVKLSAGWNTCYVIGSIATINGGDANISFMAFTYVSDTTTFKVKNIRISDLTQMFGAGNEPTTYEEFLQRKPKLADEYAHNEGELVSSHVEGVRTTGRNLWDEEWEIGDISPHNGLKVVSTNRIRTKNYIPIVGGVAYFNRNQVGYVAFYDKDKKFINAAWRIANSIFTAPTNAQYMMFGVYETTTYKNDICINVSDPSFNGQYEPYEEHERKWTETIRRCFPDGMRSNGETFDEFTPTKAAQRIGKDTFDGRDWKRSTNYWYFTNAELANKIKVSDSFAAKVTATYSFTNFAVVNNSIIRVYTDDAVNQPYGYFYYELAEPIVTEYDELNLSERVAVGGMEEAIVPEGVESALLSADIIYPIDAYNTIKSNKQRIGTLEQKPANTFTADEVTKLRALINVSTQSEGGEV